MVQMWKEKPFIKLYNRRGESLGDSRDYQIVPGAYDYIIFNDGDKVKAKNCREGRIEVADTDSGYVLTTAAEELKERFGGGLIKMATGMFEGETTAYIPADVGLVGSGKRATILKFPVALSSQAGEASHRSALMNLAIYQADVSFDYGLYIKTPVDYITLRNLLIQRCTTAIKTDKTDWDIGFSNIENLTIYENNIHADVGGIFISVLNNIEMAYGTPGNGSMTIKDGSVANSLTIQHNKDQDFELTVSLANINGLYTENDSDYAHIGIKLTGWHGHIYRAYAGSNGSIIVGDEANPKDMYFMIEDVYLSPSAQMNLYGNNITVTTTFRDDIYRIHDYGQNNVIIYKLPDKNGWDIIGRLRADEGLGTKTLVGDYGGNFANLTLPSDPVDGMLLIAIDTNSTSPGKRLYVYANSAWHYVDLT